ncbi:hypothetical protein CIHG_09340 [Coccidioides immitis H538.4]|uniref:BZIP domain-containing protein n=1 Tax=Coccidioides immitis H538.4 TaxID=396776 RepID=A0A0J8S292_COCIT|nr:hypothetical protein CIHG_09340 [Coccidioides immitis H538.4]
MQTASQKALSSLPLVATPCTEQSIAASFFAKRRERHVKALEERLHRLHEQYRELLQSYARQSEEVGRLNDRIKELMAELETLKPENAMEFNNMVLQHRSGNFDALPYPPAAFFRPSRPCILSCNAFVSHPRVKKLKR